MRLAPTAILFDWDNTLANGWAAIQAGLNAAFRDFGLPEWSMEQVLANTRRSMAESFPAIFGEQWHRARDVFYVAVREQHLQVLRPMPGTAPMLQLAMTIAPLAIVSNKQGPMLRDEVAHLRWDGFFRAAVGAGDASADKPSAAPLHMALRACAVPAGPEAWYIGDTALDMQAARAAGMTAVLLGDASHDGGIAACNPDMQFADAAALAAHLVTLDKRSHMTNA
ncbi:MAG: HAD family hydrolase [Alphaproteobacteria bacterium]|nr:HAD family hydrolase [Alphaproteobacteria bacterium]